MQPDREGGLTLGQLVSEPVPLPQFLVISCCASATASQIRRHVLNLWRGDHRRSIAPLALRVASGEVYVS